MEPIPDPEFAPVIRTDFSHQSIWEQVRAEIQKPIGILHFRASVEFIDDPQYADLSRDQLLALLPPNYNHSFIIVVDEIALSHPEHPLLVVDLFDKPGHSFRAIPAKIPAIENNLSIANMDFEEFATAADADGIFRGFPGEEQNPWMSNL